MPILDKLFHLYNRHGHYILNGVLPEFSGLPYTEFTYIITKDGKSTGALGVSPAEVTFFEHLFRDWFPKNILVIGNSFGWSTLALALLNQNSQIIALELGGENFTDQWIELTNTIAQSEALSVRVIKGKSPEDVGMAVACFDESRVDFCFIDGLHTSEQVLLDFSAVAAFSSPETVFVFHDVAYWNLFDGIRQIENISQMRARYLYRTSSGMVALYHPENLGNLDSVIEAFEVSPRATRLLELLSRGESPDQISIPDIADGQTACWMRDRVTNSPNEKVNGEGRLMELKRRIAEQEAAFSALLEDRKKAQEIMEHQARIISELRGY